MSGGQYSAVPNPGNAHLEADLGADRPASYMSEGSIMGRSDPYLGSNDGPGPEPSIISRDSTHSSLRGPPSVMGSHTARSSWGSIAPLGVADGGAAGADFGSRPRVGSSLAYSSPFPDDDNEQGHIQPNAALSGTDKEMPAWSGNNPPKKRRSRALLWALIAALVLILIGIGVGVGLGVSKPWNKNTGDNKTGSDDKGGAESTASGESGGTKTTPTASASASPSPSPPPPTWGGQGSIITFEDNTTYTYNNKFGGIWVSDPQNPLNNSAYPNSWTRPLSEPWNWGTDVIKGVNLGGWLNTEPFICPNLYEETPDGPAGTSVDEYTLSVNLQAKGQLESALTRHYETFITEQDFAEIASAGLNWVRIPIAHWAVATWDDEPFLERVSWRYFLKALQWARKYGIRVNLDLHTVPGSQNGWNHSGKLGEANWLKGPMGLANAQRALDIIRTLAQFIAQDEWAPVVQMFGFVNEPNAAVVSREAIASFTIEAYNIIREITGIGAGKGPMVSMHNSFSGNAIWADFGRGADRLGLDQHMYLVFQDQLGPDPSQFANAPCENWARGTNETSASFGPNNAGEFSAAVNDCGHWVTGVGLGTRFEGTYDGFEGRGIGQCDYWNDYRLWDDATKQTMLTYVSGAMDALQNYFFWTWKIGNSTNAALPQPNAMWHYRLGLQQGWIPEDPRSVVGHCIAAGVEPYEFYTYTAPGMTGADPNAQIQTGQFTWPPANFTDVGAGQMSSLPQYTPTATPVTLPGPTHTPPGKQEAFDFGSGWYKANDNARREFAPIAGCTYMNEYQAATMAIPAGACGAGLAQPTRRSVDERNFPAPTAAPARR